MIRIETTYTKGTDLPEVTKDIEREISAFEDWIHVEKGSDPLTSYEKGILRTYFIYLIERGPHVGIESSL